MPTRIARKRRKAARERIRQREVRKRLRGNKRQRMLAFLMKAWWAVSWTWKGVGVVIALLGMVSLAYFFSWELSVTPGQTLKESDPFATMFILQNDGQFPVYDVEFACELNDVEYPTGLRIIRTTSVTGGFNIPTLGANEKTSTPCFLAVGISDPLIKADVSLQVSYRPSFFPFRRSKSYRFMSARKEDGTYFWTPIAN